MIAHDFQIFPDSSHSPHLAKTCVLVIELIPYMLLDVACTYLHHLAPIAKVMEGGATPLMVAARLGRSSVAP